MPPPGSPESERELAPAFVILHSVIRHCRTRMSQFDAAHLADARLASGGGVLDRALGKRVLREQSHWPVVLALAGSLVISLRAGGQGAPHGAGAKLTRSTSTKPLWTWAIIDHAHCRRAVETSVHGRSQGRRHADLRVEIALRADPLTAMMLAMVTFVALAGGRSFAPATCTATPATRGSSPYISLFVFSMSMLVSVEQLPAAVRVLGSGGPVQLPADRLLVPEARGGRGRQEGVPRQPHRRLRLCPGHLPDLDDVRLARLRRRRRSAAGVFGRRCRAARHRRRDHGDLPAAVRCGACGKSAQFPLHVWLPDAMEGPTPVSALIHAATMVTAGVYLVARCTPLFVARADGAAGRRRASAASRRCSPALIALTQIDLKRVLAYSTVSQLGYMFLALGSAARPLAALAIGRHVPPVHARVLQGPAVPRRRQRDARDGRRDRHAALQRPATVLPITHWTFLVGCLALAGVFPLAGFWSKDEILAAVYDKAAARPIPWSATSSGRCWRRRW